MLWLKLRPVWAVRSCTVHSQGLSLLLFLLTSITQAFLSYLSSGYEPAIAKWTISASHSSCLRIPMRGREVYASDSSALLLGLWATSQATSFYSPLLHLSCPQNFMRGRVIYPRFRPSSTQYLMRGRVTYQGLRIWVSPTKFHASNLLSFTHLILRLLFYGYAMRGVFALLSHAEESHLSIRDFALLPLSILCGGESSTKRFMHLIFRITPLPISPFLLSVSHAGESFIYQSSRSWSFAFYFMQGRI